MESNEAMKGFYRFSALQPNYDAVTEEKKGYLRRLLDTTF